MEMGRHVPEDCAIVGCDDVPLAALVSPALTTIHIPTYNLGQRTMSLLFDMMGKEANHPQPIIISPHLVIRDSSGQRFA
jgi:DNA-binding LacI/PurR family transcriptional regulator